MRRALALLLAAVLSLALVPTATADDTTPICEIQGDGDETPLLGDEVTTTGVVYATQFIGFWMQDVGCDGDPATSDGIFVFSLFAAGADPAVGDLVEVSGTASEFFEATQVSADEVTVLSSGNPLPEPTLIDPEDARTEGYYETLEHMRVELAFGQTHVGTNRFGESFLVPLEEGEEITDRIRRTDDAPELFALDDGLGERVDTFAFDTVAGGVGPLTFTFGAYKLYVEDADDVTITSAGDRPAPIIPQEPGQLTFAAWNLFNVFDEDDPDPSIGVPAVSPADQAVKRAKIARAVIDDLGAPEVLAVQEVENLALLEAIATEINAALGEPGRYRAILEEGNDVRGIDVGFLVDTDALEVLSVDQVGADAVSDGRCQSGPDENLVYDRVPLAVELRAANGETFTAISNHFKSKFGGTPANDFFEDCRVEQAEVLRDWLRTEHRGQQRVVLLGDFNAFRDSRTLATLTEGNYANTVDRIPEDRRFSFVFTGRVQFLDHIVVSSDLASRVAAVDSAKVSADVPFPAFEDDAATGWGASDHDPIVLHLELLPQVSGSP